MPATYTFQIDNFKVTRDGAVIFEDAFEDGLPPPDGPPLPGAPAGADPYLTIGVFGEAGGRAVMHSDNDVGNGVEAVPSAGPNGTIESLHAALLATNIDPADTAQGLKINHDFTVEGRFDLDPDGGDIDPPNDVSEAFGIRLTDRSPDQPGDDIIELAVRRGPDNNVYVQLRELDFVSGDITKIDGKMIDATDIDQVVLRLAHDEASPGVVTGSFDLINGGGEVVSSVTFAKTGSIFGTETPESGDDENWTRAQFVAYAPDPDFPVNNLIEGNNQSDLREGTPLADDIYGFGGNDKLYALPGDDRLFGGAGDDFLGGGLGHDTMFGGSGNDTYRVDNFDDQVIENPGGIDQGGVDTVESFINYKLGDLIENLVLLEDATNGDGNSLNNEITGNAAANTLTGADGNDTLAGGAGADTIFGGNGDDSIRGGSDSDRLRGEAGADTIDGGKNADTINGGEGSDVLFGGTGEGKDRFVFIVNEANGDTIMDFDGNGAAAGDSILFLGYGDGATFHQLGSSNQWEIASADRAVVEVITLANSASVHTSDVFFGTLLL